MVYKSCAVPMCSNTTSKYPEKLFIHVPTCPKRRMQWLKLARREPKLTPKKSAITFCEDHFDLPNDMENYIQYSIMGSVRTIRMKPNCLPSRFKCQPDRAKRTAPPQPRSAVSKRQRMDVIQEILSKETSMSETSGLISNNHARAVMQKHATDAKEICDRPTTSTNEVGDRRTSSNEVGDRPSTSNEIEKNEISDHDDEYIVGEDVSKLDTSFEGDQYIPQIHPDLCCDECREDIVGFRYTCVQCENYHLCGRCEIQLLHPHHYTLRVPAPRPAAEIESIIEAIRNKLTVLFSEDKKTFSANDDDIIIKKEEDPFGEMVSNITPDIPDSSEDIMDFETNQEATDTLFHEEKCIISDNYTIGMESTKEKPIVEVWSDESILESDKNVMEEIEQNQTDSKVSRFQSPSFKQQYLRYLDELQLDTTESATNVRSKTSHSYIDKNKTIGHPRKLLKSTGIISQCTSQSTEKAKKAGPRSRVLILSKTQPRSLNQKLLQEKKSKKELPQNTDMGVETREPPNWSKIINTRCTVPITRIDNSIDMRGSNTPTNQGLTLCNTTAEAVSGTDKCEAVVPEYMPKIYLKQQFQNISEDNSIYKIIPEL